MTRPEDRQTLAYLIAKARTDGAPQATCALAGIDPRTLQRWGQNDGLTRGDRRPDAIRPTLPHALTKGKCACIVEVTNQPRVAETPPARIVPMLADEGVYIASESSFHRVLRSRPDEPPQPRQAATPIAAAHHAQRHPTESCLVLGCDVFAGSGSGEMLLSVPDPPVPDPRPLQPEDRWLQGA